NTRHTRRKLRRIVRSIGSGCHHDITRNNANRDRNINGGVAAAVRGDGGRAYEILAIAMAERTARLAGKELDPKRASMPAVQRALDSCARTKNSCAVEHGKVL